MSFNLTKSFSAKFLNTISNLFSAGEHKIANNPDINRNLGDFNRAVSDADSYNWSMDATKG